MIGIRARLTSHWSGRASSMPLICESFGAPLNSGVRSLRPRRIIVDVYLENGQEKEIGLLSSASVGARRRSCHTYSPPRACGVVQLYVGAKRPVARGGQIRHRLEPGREIFNRLLAHHLDPAAKFYNDNRCSLLNSRGAKCKS